MAMQMHRMRCSGNCPHDAGINAVAEYIVDGMLFITMVLHCLKEGGLVWKSIASLRVCNLAAAQMSSTAHYSYMATVALHWLGQGTVPDTGTSCWLKDHAERQLLGLHHVPKQCVSMHVVYMYIHKLPFQLQPISREEHRLVLAVPPHSLIGLLLGVWPFHQHLQ
jgi:hypothetical protein